MNKTIRFKKTACAFGASGADSNSKPISCRKTIQTYHEGARGALGASSARLATTLQKDDR
jgi:hypothetical protein